VCGPLLQPILEQPEVFVAWFTGLPGAGKSTLATLVGQELEQQGDLDRDSRRRPLPQRQHAEPRLQQT
jgi:adenylylsulfate kinase-like enzyme